MIEDKTKKEKKKSVVLKVDSLKHEWAPTIKYPFKGDRIPKK